jgi:16S rRNA (adenine1518-N6/adenine1519-N6)-dimethyltransferase
VTLSRADVQRLLADHGIRPSRALGQNFVVDPNTVRRIVRLAGVTDRSSVIEIGAGLGSLTLALAETGARVVAVELDRYIVPVLREVVAPWAVEVIEADALDLDWEQLLGRPDSRRPWSMVANLPYNVAMPLVIRTLEEAPQIDSLLVMVQSEVAERMAAKPSTKAYGAASIKIAYWASASVAGRVPPTVFLPRPRVDSALVRIRRRAVPAVSPGVVDYDRLFEVVRAGFGQRRKMLRRALAGVVEPGAFEGARVAPTARAEDLGVEDWGRLAAWGQPTP